MISGFQNCLVIGTLIDRIGINQTKSEWEGYFELIMNEIQYCDIDIENEEWKKQWKDDVRVARDNVGPDQGRWYPKVCLNT